MKFLCLVGLSALFFGSGLVSWAQRIDPGSIDSTPTQPAYPWVVKLAPLSLFDIDNTIQFGLERLVSQHGAVQVEFGYGWQGLNLWQSSQNERYSNREIWRGRVEWRHYLNKTNQPRGRYMAVEGFYKQVNVRESGTVGVGCTAGPCQYYQLFSSPLQKYVWGGHVKFGSQMTPIRGKNRLLLDMYVGLGFRRRMIERFQPSGDSFYYRSAGYTLFDSFSGTSYTLISLSYGARLGWAF